MSDLTLTRTRLRHGVWEGQITGAKKPEVQVTYLDRPVEGVTLTDSAEPGIWELSVTVPPEAISDGVQTFVIADVATGTRLGDFTLIAGEANADDLRAEVELLRAELDMLKRAFRRHRVETS